MFDIMDGTLTSETCDGLLAQWQTRREMVNAYHRALRLLAPESAGRHDGARRELNAKLAEAISALRVASEQLGCCEQRHVGARSA